MTTRAEDRPQKEGHTYIGNLIGALISRYLINTYYEVKVYFFNNKIISYLKKKRINYYIVENKDMSKLIIFYLSKKELDKTVKVINRLSKKCIIYINEARKYSRILKENNVLQIKDNML